MDPVRIRVSRILDFGTIVSIVGIDAESNATVVVHVDHRPLAAVREAWGAAGFPEPIEFDAENLTLKLDIDAEEQQERAEETDDRAEEQTL